MEKIWKHGDINSQNGNIFWSYSDKAHTKEGWLTPKSFKKKKIQKKKYYNSEKGQQYFKNWFHSIRKWHIFRGCLRRMFF